VEAWIQPLPWTRKLAFTLPSQVDELEINGRAFGSELVGVVQGPDVRVMSITVPTGRVRIDRLSAKLTATWPSTTTGVGRGVGEALNGPGMAGAGWYPAPPPVLPPFSWGKLGADPVAGQSPDPLRL
jgi:hypothetical protein